MDQKLDCNFDDIPTYQPVESYVQSPRSATSTAPSLKLGRDKGKRTVYAV